MGTEEELTCQVACGNPSNYTYKWFNDSSDVSFSDVSKIILSSDEIKVANIKCCASNGFGSEKCASKVLNWICEYLDFI